MKCTAGQSLEWEALEAAGWDFLITRAKRPDDPRTNYT